MKIFNIFLMFVSGGYFVKHHSRNVGRRSYKTWDSSLQPCHGYKPELVYVEAYRAKRALHFTILIEMQNS